MRVWRAARFVLPFLVIAVLIAAVVSVFSARPDLEQAQDDVDTAWTPLQTELGQRYVLLAGAGESLRDTGGPTSELVTSLNDAVAHWNDVQGKADVAAQVAAANDLEAVGRRLVATITASSRPSAESKAAMAAFAADRSYESATAFNKAVLAYEGERRGPVRQLVAKALGNDAIEAYDTPPEPVSG